MEVQLPPSPPGHDDDHPWDQLERAQSQPPPGHRDNQRARTKRPPKHLRPRSANSAVISSILDSFDTLTPPPVPQAGDYGLDARSIYSKRSRRRSSDGTVSSTRSVAPGLGAENGHAVSPLYETPLGEAAPSPSVPTSRPPSGLYSHVAPPPRLHNSDASFLLQPTSLISPRSSRSSLSKEKENGVKTKHSAESWLKHRTPSQSSLDTKAWKTRSKGVRRETSQDMSGRLRIDELATPAVAVEVTALSRAEQIIGKTPPPLKSKKGRRNLAETASEQQRTASVPSGASNALEAEHSRHNSEAATIAEQTTLNAIPARISPSKSPIVDSIPTRTSSLRVSSSPVARKRDKKSKPPSAAGNKPLSLIGHRSRSIPESSWADLGEDDDTVKRIRELREQRQSWIDESRHFSLPAGMPPSNADEPLAPESAVPKSEGAKRATRFGPAAHRSVTTPPVQTHHEVHAAATPSLGRDVTDKAASGASHPPESMRRPPAPPEEKAHAGPSTAGPPTPPLSLDYSYAQAVDALHGAERELARSKRSERAPPKTSSAPLTKPDISPTSSRRRPKSAGRKGESKSGKAAAHSDLASDQTGKKKKSGRKSTGDERRARDIEDQLEAQRRDSIEEAVWKYLRAPRLSRTVQHAPTGRVISFSEVGDPEGAAVFVCVGMGLTRYVTAFYDDLATTLRLRLITIDRPGVSGSDPYPPTHKSGPLSWPDDILAICQHLGITKFSLLAHSAGAIYALATALTLPHLVHGKVHLLAPWIPPSQLEAVPTASALRPGALPRSQRILRVLPTSFLRAANSSFMAGASSSLKPASKRQLNASKERSREPSLSPISAAERSPIDQRPAYPRRESMMLMDQLMPTTENFPIPVKEDREGDGDDAGSGEARRAPPRNSLALTATATPADPGFAFAASGLDAAEHAEKLAVPEAAAAAAAAAADNDADNDDFQPVEYTSRLTQRTWELATRDSNPATDLLVCLERHREIGFRYTDVLRDIVITHGAEDKRVPLGNVQWLAKQLSARDLADAGRDSTATLDGGHDEANVSRGGCELRVLEGEGHGLMASAPIMSDILTEIAGYWVGQPRE